MIAQVRSGQLPDQSIHLRHLASDVPLEAQPAMSLTFTAADLAVGSVKIGAIGPDRHIHTAVCTITSPFDTGVVITIGDADAHGRIMSTAEIYPQGAYTYQGRPHLSYADQTDLYVYLEAGTPTHGAGDITLYYQ